MIRRVHVANLSAGSIEIPPRETHHVRDVLRLNVGDEIELFDDAGNSASAKIESCTGDRIIARVDSIAKQVNVNIDLTIASAIPKGERADWMIEKLSELGVARFVPLLTERSVVQASGKNKIERWERIAIEAAKQSRRSGVMKIDVPRNLGDAIANLSPAFVLSTARDAMPFARIEIADSIALFIGPEGGWSDNELSQFASRQIAPVRLTNTVLRVETAAIAVAVIILAREKTESSR